jgi:hypothetical protein
MSEITEEQLCIHMLQELRAQYEQDAKPFVDRLVAIKSMQTKTYVVKEASFDQTFMDINP